MTFSVSLPLAFAAGLLSFLSPCVLPLVPVYLSYISGSTVLEQVTASRWRALSQALAFVAGFGMVFVVLFGLPTTLLGVGLQRYGSWISRVGGAILIVLGLQALGLLRLPELRLSGRLESARRRKPGHVRSTMLGATLAISWTPCIGPLLGIVMTLAFTDPGRGLLLLSVYTFGLAMPFLLAALLLTQAIAWLRRLSKLMPFVKVASGLLLLSAGVLLLMGKMSVLNAHFARMTPQWLLL